MQDDLDFGGALVTLVRAAVNRGGNGSEPAGPVPTHAETVAAARVLVAEDDRIAWEVARILQSDYLTSVLAILAAEYRARRPDPHQAPRYGAGGTGRPRRRGMSGEELAEFFEEQRASGVVP